MIGKNNIVKKLKLFLKENPAQVFVYNTKCE